MVDIRVKDMKVYCPECRNRRRNYKEDRLSRQFMSNGRTWRVVYCLVTGEVLDYYEHQWIYCKEFKPW